ncbi:type IV secretory system conjugative DNA transfer family protein [Streptodolium elevatio]
MSATRRRRGPNPFYEWLLGLACVVILVVVAFAAWGAAAITSVVEDKPAPPESPWHMVEGLMRGTYKWPGTGAYIALGLILVVVFGLVAYVVYRILTRDEVLVDRAIRFLAKDRDLRGFTTEGVSGIAQRLNVPEDAPPGVYLGKAVRNDRDLWGSWEDMHVDIWGPRTGKTATRAIPNIVAAPGPVVVTSNKRDVVDATRISRQQRGKVWVFDPQSQAGEKPTWYWDPMTYVGNSIVRAMKITGRFSSINRPAHARSDAYFEPAAEDLIAHLLLAASEDGKPITQVYTWLTRPNDDAPARILREAGHDISADAVEANMASPDRQRAGVYGTATQIMSFLTAPNITEWVTPGANPDRPTFDYKTFAETTDTIYLLSEETNKAAAPLVLALTAALAEEAENTGIRSPGGRLPLPMLFVLDEAANVCPWKALPDKYSHFGSRGIVMMTILQSWAQGAAAWGENGMSKLWGAANVRVYGGGVADMKFLGDLSKASGVFEPGTTSITYKWGDPRGISRSSRPEAVLNEADLASMPRGRAFVQFSGTPPVLVKTVPWWEGPHAATIRKSIARYEPGPPAPAAPVPPAPAPAAPPPVPLGKTT